MTENVTPTPATPAAPLNPISTVSGLQGLLTSRRFIVAIVCLILGIATQLVPELRSVREELLTLIIALGLTLIGGYTLTDAVSIGRERAGRPASEDDLRRLIEEVFFTLVDELVPDENEPAPAPPTSGNTGVVISPDVRG